MPIGAISGSGSRMIAHITHRLVSENNSPTNLYSIKPKAEIELAPAIISKIYMD